MRRDADFARWYTLHHDRIRAQCARILRDESAGEDVAQETLLLAWTRRETIRDEDVGAWLSVVARNASISYLRKHRRTIPVDVVPEVVDAGSDPSLIVEKKETRKEVRRALSEVGERHRRLLYLRDVRGVGFDELGAEFGLTAGGTRALLFRARGVLRERLALAGQGLGAWVVGVRLKIGGAARRVRASVGVHEASATPLLNAGISLALAAGLAVSTIAGLDPLTPSSGGLRPSFVSVALQPSVDGAVSRMSAVPGDTGSSQPTGAVRERGALLDQAEAVSPVHPRVRYDKEKSDHFIGVFVDLPLLGRQCVCESGRQEPDKHSITYDVIVNPTLEKVCNSSMGFCETQ